MAGISVPPRLIAFDLDGTILRADSSLSPRTLDALHGLHERDIQTLFVTGRPPRWVDHLEGAVGGHGQVICGNGAFHYAIRERRIARTVGIEPPVLGSMVRDLRAALPEATFAAELGTRMCVEEGFIVQAGRADGWLSEKHEHVGGVDRVEAPVGKLLLMLEACAGEPAELVRQVRDVVGARGAVVTSGVPGLVEVGPPGVSKASALAGFCEVQGIEAGRVWAFGDQVNDIPMLRWAGRSFAVGEAPAVVRKNATDTAAGPEADGVAQWLETLLR